jgi:hypothetical protein
MARILCPVHGGSPVQLVCSHIGDDFNERRPLRPSRNICVLLRGHDVSEAPWFEILVCEACVQDCGPVSGADTLYDDEVEEGCRQLCHPHVLCLHCYQERTRVDPH